MNWFWRWIHDGLRCNVFRLLKWWEGMDRWRSDRLRANRNEFAKELPVADCYSARSVNSHDILMVLSDFNDESCPVPFSWMVADLILKADMISNLKGWDKLGTKLSIVRRF